MTAEHQSWEPIKTVPKTRKAILVWTPEFRNILTVTWDDHCNGWKLWGSSRLINDRITHWMNLPLPPTYTPIPTIMTTTADEHLKKAREAIQTAITELSAIVVNECEGHDDYTSGFKKRIHEGFDYVMSARDYLKPS